MERTPATVSSTRVNSAYWRRSARAGGFSATDCLFAVIRGDVFGIVLGKLAMGETGARKRLRHCRFFAVSTRLQANNLSTRQSKCSHNPRYLTSESGRQRNVTFQEGVQEQRVTAHTVVPLRRALLIRLVRLRGG